MTQLNFNGQVAIVTGAGRILGKAYAVYLASRGAKVLVNDLGVDMFYHGTDKSHAERAAEEIRAAGGIAEANGDSVTTAEGAQAIVQQALDTWGSVDIVINNAGVVTGHGPLDKVTDEMWETDMAVSARGTFNMMRAVWRHMLDKNYGRIVNVASASFIGLASSLPYPASKGAVIGMTRSSAAATKIMKKDIKVNAIMPLAWSLNAGFMGEEIENIMKRDIPPRAVAPVVAYLAHKDVPCSGEIFSVAGGGFARVFLGVTKGYRGENKELEMEEVEANFASAMDTDGFVIPANSMEEGKLYKTSIPWDNWLGFIE